MLHLEHKLVITKQKDTIISSLLEGNELVQIHVEKDATDQILGNVYLGKVKNIVKNINAAFLEIADGTMCYYSLDDNTDPIFKNAKNTDKVVIGDEIIVQVVKENIKTKAPVVSCHINLTGKYVVLTHGKTKLGVSNKIDDEALRKSLKSLLKKYKNDQFGLIARTNAKEATPERIKEEIESLIAQYEKLKSFGVKRTSFSLLYKSPANYICDIRDGYSTSLEKIITDEKEIYDSILQYMSEFQKEDLSKLSFYEDKLLSLSNLYSIQTKLEKALRQNVWLKSGGYLVIQPTEALTVIDVNTGKAIAGKRTSEQTFYKINCEAAVEIAKQIRLRNLSGIIIIDFIDMVEEEHKQALMNQLRSYFAKDPIKTTVVDMTALNLVEVTRKKVRKPLHECQITI